jgi:hypothetical protein
VDGHVEILGRSGEEATDVGVGSEPKGPAMEKAGDESLCQKGGRLVEEWPRVEDLEHLRVRMPHDRQVAPGESGEALRELTAARSVDALEESPVATGGQGQVVVVGKAVWPVPAEDSQRQVLVDDDHAGGVPGSVGGVVGVTAEEGVGDNIGVEGRLKFVRKVTGGHPTEQLFPLVAKARVPGPASSSAFLEEFFTDAHRLHCARPWLRPRPNLNYRAVQPGPKQRAEPALPDGSRPLVAGRSFWSGTSKGRPERFVPFSRTGGFGGERVARRRRSGTRNVTAPPKPRSTHRPTSVPSPGVARMRRSALALILLTTAAVTTQALPAGAGPSQDWVRHEFPCANGKGKAVVAFSPTHPYRIRDYDGPNDGVINPNGWRAWAKNPCKGQWLSFSTWSGDWSPSSNVYWNLGQGVAMRIPGDPVRGGLRERPFCNVGGADLKIIGRNAKQTQVGWDVCDG